jgi:hypothetical protein
LAGFLGSHDRITERCVICRFNVSKTIAGIQGTIRMGPNAPNLYGGTAAVRRIVSADGQLVVAFWAQGGIVHENLDTSIADVKYEPKEGIRMLPTEDPHGYNLVFV